jgi:NAD-dependent dihydropyrimidine dehydrogenase PreA subunit
MDTEDDQAPEERTECVGTCMVCLPDCPVHRAGARK